MVYLIVVLVCISLPANDAEHYFLHMLTCHLCVHLGEMSLSFDHFLVILTVEFFITALLIYNSHTVQFTIVRIMAPQVA